MKTELLPATPLPAKPDLSVLIVAHNRLDLLKKCIAAIPRAVEPLGTEVIVVDNASEDETPSWLRRENALSRVLNSENLGFSGAMNQAFELARGSFVLWLNSDCIVEAGAVARGVRFLQDHPDHYAVGGRLVGSDGWVQTSALAFPGPVAVLMHCLGLRHLLVLPGIRSFSKAVARATKMSYAESYLSERGGIEPQTTDWVTGAFLLTRKEVLANVGVLDERFWMYSEDTDWCRRVHRAGGKIAFLPTMTAMHLVGASAKGKHDFVTCQSYRSMWLYHQKHSGMAWLSHAILSIYFLVRGLGRGLTSIGRGHSGGNFWWGLFLWGAGLKREPCRGSRTRTPLERNDGNSG